jgi:WD40 repeat protein
MGSVRQGDEDARHMIPTGAGPRVSSPVKGGPALGDAAPGDAAHGGPAGAGATGGDDCPYQGLAPFEAEDSALFFGRARATESLLERLGRRLDGQGSILMVSGASGVGKSSLLRAGLLPALAKGMLPIDGSRQWPRLLLTPTSAPLRALAEHWTAVYGGDVEAAHESLRDDPGRGLPGDGRLVVVVDQFEELFTLVSEEQERQAFAEALHAIADGPSSAGVIIGVRADYWDRCAAYPRFAEAIQDGQVIVEPMTESDLRLAITGPAAAAGLELEPGLADTVLAELRAGRDADRYDAGALPLLSQALRNTWDRRENGRLTLRGYEESGRVRDAVQHTADEVFQRLPAEDRMTALRVFRRMTVITAGRRVARRRATLTELHAAAEAGSPERRDQIDALVSAFADRRLVTLDEDTAEIAHDALLTAWPTLRQWLAPDLAAQEVYDQLIEDAAQWDEHRRDPAFLYRGARLLTVNDTRPRWDRDADSFPPPGPTVDAFVAASIGATRRAERRRRVVLATLAVLTVLALIAAGAAIRAAGDAGRQRAVAISRQLAAQSEVIGDTDPTTSALLAVSAWRIAPTPEARFSMLNAAARPGRGALTGHQGVVSALAFGPGGRTIVTGSHDRTARLWDTASRRQLGAPIVPPPNDCHSADLHVAFRPDGKTLATACFGEIVRFWDVSTHQAAGRPLDNKGWVRAMAFSPDGTTFATGSQEGAIRLWDANSRRQRGDAIGRPGSDLYKAIVAMAFSSDGRRLATAADDNTVRLWDTATHHQIGAPFTEHMRFVHDVSISPDGTTLATVGIDRKVRLWSLADHHQIAVLPTGQVSDSDFGVAFSPDGTRLAVAGFNGPVQLWDIHSRQRVGFPLSDNGITPQGVAFSPDGNTLAIAGFDGVVRLVDTRVHQQVGATMPGRNAIAMSPDGRTLAAPDPSLAAATLRLWDVAAQRRIEPPIRHPDGPRPGTNDLVYRVTFSRDGTTLATASENDGLRLWDAATHRQIGPPLYLFSGKPETSLFSPDGKTFAIKDSESIRFWRTADRRQISVIKLPAGASFFDGLAMSPDGRTFAYGGPDHTVRLFDVATRRQLGPPLPAGGLAYALTFSSDGGTLASGGDDRAVRLWDVAAHRQIGTPLIGHTRDIRSMAFSPDGKVLVTTSTDRTAREWDLRTGRQIGVPLIGHTDMVIGVAYSPDGSTVATVGEDKTVRLWDVAIPADPVAAACAEAGRSFTRAEWRRYVPGASFRQVCK